MRHQRDVRLQAEAAHMGGGKHRGFGDLVGGRIDAHLGIGEEEMALGGDEKRQRGEVRRLPGAQPMTSRIWRRWRHEAAFDAANAPRRHRRARTIMAAITVALVRTTVRAASGVTPLAAGRFDIEIDIVAVARIVLAG